MTMRTEASDRWVRAYAGDVTVVDSRRPLLFWEDGFPVPAYAFPLEDVRTDLLAPTAAQGRLHPFHGPHGPVSAVFDLVTDGRTVPQAAWVRDDPALSDRIVLSWAPGVFDRWMEEDEEVVAHPRDPHSRVDALHSSRHVQVSVDGDVIADTRAPVLLFETGLPTRYYLTTDDVAMDRLEEVQHDTVCPYKGTADRYWSLPGLPNIAWAYTAPLPAVGAIAGRMAFYNEAVDITVDGQLMARPQSPFSEERP